MIITYYVTSWPPSPTELKTTKLVRLLDEISVPMASAETTFQVLSWFHQLVSSLSKSIDVTKAGARVPHDTTAVFRTGFNTSFPSVSKEGTSIL